MGHLTRYSNTILEELEEDDELKVLFSYTSLGSAFNRLDIFISF
jgi:hypothetical protein